MAECDRARTWEWEPLPRSVPVLSKVLLPESQEGRAESAASAKPSWGAMSHHCLHVNPTI